VEKSADGGEEGREGRRVESGGGGGGGGSGDDSGGVPPTLQKLVRPRERFSEQRGNKSRGGGAKFFRERSCSTPHRLATSAL